MRLPDLIEDIANDLKGTGLQIGCIVEVDDSSAFSHWSVVDRPWIAPVAKAVGRHLVVRAESGPVRVRTSVDRGDLILEFGIDDEVDSPPRLEEVIATGGLGPDEADAATRDCMLLAYPPSGSWIRFSVTGALQQNEGGAPETACLRILIAEDNPINAKMLVRLTAKKGHVPTWVENGKLCVETFRQGSFDLILMDVSMPEMDGFQATQEIRQSAVAQTRPWIVALTAHAMAGDREQCLAAGMDDYLSKPIDVEKLFKVLDSVGDQLSRDRIS